MRHLFADLLIVLAGLGVACGLMVGVVGVLEPSVLVKPETYWPTLRACALAAGFSLWGAGWLKRRDHLSL